MKWLFLLVLKRCVLNVIIIVALISIPYKKVLVWFQNFQQRKQDHKSQKSKKSKSAKDGRSALTWTLRKVVKEKFSDEIDALVLKKDPEAKRGSQGYLKIVQDCLTTFINSLSKEVKQEFEDLADQRNAEGVDADLKAQ